MQRLVVLPLPHLCTPQRYHLVLADGLLADAAIGAMRVLHERVLPLRRPPLSRSAAAAPFLFRIHFCSRFAA